MDEMDELRSRTEQLVEAAGATHGPPRGATGRAPARLETSLAAAAGGSVSTALAPPTLWRRAQAALASVMLCLLGVHALHIRDRNDPSRRHEVAPSGPDSAMSESKQDAETELPATDLTHTSSAYTAQPATPEAMAPLPHPRPTNAPDLAGEIHILKAAAAAVDHHDFSRADTLLQNHRARFGTGQLKQERVGLENLVRCLRRSPDAATRARAYLRAAPYALLSARIRTACAID